MTPKMPQEVPNFISTLPKIELHAHLNGSLKLSSILELGEKLYGENTNQFKNLTQSFINFKGLDLEACFKKFQFMHDLTATQKGLRLATQMVIRDYVADNVIYLELRTTPKSNDTMTKLEYLKTVLDTIQNAKETINGKIIIKLLPSFDRSRPIQDAVETLEILLKLRLQSKQYMQLIPGIDLSGNPSRGSFQDFKSALQRARENGLKLAIHCAEIDNPQEVEEMLAFKMDRCGHGTFLSPTQIVELAKQNVAIECCLTSNVKSATVGSFSDHHFRHIIKQEYDGIEENRIAVLCTDDSGVFDTTLSNELEIAAKTFKLTKENLIQLQLNAVAHTFANEAERKILIAKINEYCNFWNIKIP